MMALLLTLGLVWSTGSVQELETVKGDPFSLARLFERAPAMVVFWNSWLPESEEFIPLVREIEAAATSRGWPGVVVIFQDDDPGAAARLGPGEFPRVLDRRGRLARELKVTRAPMVVLVDAGGAVTARAGPDAAAVRELLRAGADP